MSQQFVFAVCSSNYDHHAVEAVFTTREAAEAALVTLREHWDAAKSSDDLAIEEYKLDPPQSEWPGTWTVYVDASGREVEREAWTFPCKETHQALPKGWGEIVARGYGKTPEEALANARNLGGVTVLQAHPEEEA